MSWQTVNRILGRAAIDPAFRQHLEEDPLATLAAEDFDLTSEELETFARLAALPFPEFCQRLLDELGPGTAAR
jgi:hypothetical protein